MEDFNLFEKIKPFIQRTDEMLARSQDEIKKQNKKQMKKNMIPEKKCQLCDKTIIKQEYFKLISNQDFCLCLSCKKKIESNGQQLNYIHRFLKKFDDVFIKDETFTFTSYSRKNGNNEITIKLKEEIPQNEKEKFNFNFVVNQPNEKEELITIPSNKYVQDLFFEIIIHFGINIDFYDLEYKYKNITGRLSRDNADRQLASMFPYEIINIKISSKDEEFSDEYYYTKKDPINFREAIDTLFIKYFKEITEDDNYFPKKKFLNFLGKNQSVKDYINQIYENEVEDLDPNQLKNMIITKGISGNNLFLNLMIGFMDGNPESPYLIKYEKEQKALKPGEEEEKNAELKEMEEELAEEEMEYKCYDIKTDKKNMATLEALLKNYIEGKKQQRENPNLIIKDMEDVKKHIIDLAVMLCSNKSVEIKSVETYEIFYIIMCLNNHKDRGEYSFNFILNCDPYFLDLYEIANKDIFTELKDEDIKDMPIDDNNKHHFYLMTILRLIEKMINQHYGDIDEEEFNDDIKDQEIKNILDNFNFEDPNYFSHLKLLIKFLSNTKRKADINKILTELLKNKDNFKDGGDGENNGEGNKILKDILLYILDDKLNKELIENQSLIEILNDKFEFYMKNYQENNYHELLAYILLYFALFSDNDALVNEHLNTLKKIYLRTENINLQLSIIYSLTKFKNNRIIGSRAVMNNFKKKNNNLSSIFMLAQIIYFNKKLRNCIIKNSEENNGLANLFKTLEEQKNLSVPINVETFFDLQPKKFLNLIDACYVLQNVIPNPETDEDEEDQKLNFDFFSYEGATDKISLLKYKNLENPPNFLMIKAYLEKFPKLKMDISPSSEDYYKLNAILFEDYGDTNAFYCISQREDFWYDIKKGSYVTNIKATILNLCGVSKEVYFLYKLKPKEKFDFSENFLKDFYNLQKNLDKEMISLVLEYLIIDTKNVVNNHWGKFTKFMKKDMYCKKKTVDFLNLYFDEICDKLRNNYGPKGADTFLNKVLLVLESISEEFQEDINYKDLLTRVKKYDEK
ncbi:MAG: hypothetical protein MJ252_17890 [archaeon]|nr:hypothetical protein [archaeon]